MIQELASYISPCALSCTRAPFPTMPWVGGSPRCHWEPPSSVTRKGRVSGKWEVHHAVRHLVCVGDACSCVCPQCMHACVCKCAPMSVEVGD